MSVDDEELRDGEREDSSSSELPDGTEMLGRAVSFPGLTDAALDATGQRSCTLVTAADGLTTADIAAPSLSKWQFRVKPTSIRAVKNVGTMIIMQ